VQPILKSSKWLLVSTCSSDMWQGPNLWENTFITRGSVFKDEEELATPADLDLT